MLGKWLCLPVGRLGTSVHAMSVPVPTSWRYKSLSVHARLVSVPSSWQIWFLQFIPGQCQCLPVWQDESPSSVPYMLRQSWCLSSWQTKFLLSWLGQLSCLPLADEVSPAHSLSAPMSPVQQNDKVSLVHAKLLQVPYSLQIWYSNSMLGQCLCIAVGRLDSPR